MQTVAQGRLSKVRLVAHSFKFNRLQRLPIPWLLLLLSLVVTVFVWRQEQQLLQTRIQTRLRQEIAYTNQALENEFAYSQEALYSARSFLVANDGVTLAMWQRYVESLDLAARYPGLVELGYVAYVPEADLPGFVETLRQSAGGAAPHVATGQSDYLITQFVYAQEAEQLAVGQDLGADFALRSVAERARDLGEVVISRKVELAGLETAVNPIQRAGVFLFLPVYGEQETAVQGWVYATVSTQALLEDVLGFLDAGLLRTVLAMWLRHPRVAWRYRCPRVGAGAFFHPARSRRGRACGCCRASFGKYRWRYAPLDAGRRPAAVSAGTGCLSEKQRVTGSRVNPAPESG